MGAVAGAARALGFLEGSLEWPDAPGGGARGPGRGGTSGPASALGGGGGRGLKPLAGRGPGCWGDLRGLGVGADEALELARHGTGRALRLEGLGQAVGLELRERLRALGGRARRWGPARTPGQARLSAGRPWTRWTWSCWAAWPQLEALAERLDVAGRGGPLDVLAGAIRRALVGATWRPRDAAPGAPPAGSLTTGGGDGDRQRHPGLVLRRGAPL